MQTVTRVCPICSASLVTLKASAKYCSHACRQEAYRRRTKGVVELLVNSRASNGASPGPNDIAPVIHRGGLEVDDQDEPEILSDGDEIPEAASSVKVDPHPHTWWVPTGWVAGEPRWSDDLTKEYLAKKHR